MSIKSLDSKIDFPEMSNIHVIEMKHGTVVLNWLTLTDLQKQHSIWEASDFKEKEVWSSWDLEVFWCAERGCAMSVCWICS